MQSSQISFDLSKPLKRGNLLKQGGFHKAFKHREFILYPGFLVYYDNEKSWRQDITKGEEMAGRLGSIKLMGATISIAKNAPKGCKYGIQIAAPDIENKRQDYLVNASSKEERDEWIDALRKATPLPSKNLSRKTTALKAAMTLSSQLTEEDDELGIGTISSDEDSRETDIDNILSAVGDADHTSSDRQDGITDRQSSSSDQETNLEDEQHGGASNIHTGGNLTQSRSEWVEPRAADGGGSVIEISIEVGDAGGNERREGNDHADNKNSGGNNHNSSKKTLSLKHKHLRQQHKDKPQSKYSMISPGVFQRTSSQGSAGKEWHDPADLEAQRVLIPGVGWRVPGMNVGAMPPRKFEQNYLIVADEAKEMEKEDLEEVKAQCYRTIVPYTADGPAQISFDEGEILYVLDKLEDGWWFVSNGKDEGWAPCSYLEGDKDEEGITNLEGRTETYYSIDEYTPEEDDEVSLSCGEKVEVLMKSVEGWWMVKDRNGRMGLAPATFLKKMEATETNSSPSSSPRRRPPPIPTQRIYQQPPRKASVRARARLKTSHGEDDKTCDPKTSSPAPPKRPEDGQVTKRAAQAEASTRRVKNSPSTSQNFSSIEQECDDVTPHGTAGRGDTKTDLAEKRLHKPAIKSRTKSPRSHQLVKSRSLDADQVTGGESPSYHQRALSSTPEPTDRSKQDKLSTEVEGPRRPTERPKSYEIRQAKLRARSLAKSTLTAKSDEKISTLKSNTVRPDNIDRGTCPAKKENNIGTPSSYSPTRETSPHKPTPKKRSRDKSPVVNHEVSATPPQEGQEEAALSSYQNAACPRAIHQ